MEWNMEFPQIMGILNVTPDSFSDGGMYISEEAAIEHAYRLASLGADIIDIGGESTRPGANEVPEDEEIERVIPIVKQVRKELPNIKISIDTTKFKVAKLAIEAGANIINDVSGLNFDEKLSDLAAQNDASLIIMHMQGKPRNMQKNPVYNNVVEDVYKYLSEKTELAKAHGVKDVIVDVGIGFGKTYDHNIQLLKNIEKFNNITGKQLLGISRKSFIGKMLDIETPRTRDIATSLIHSVLLQKNIHIIRVHNVEQIVQLKKISQTFL